MKVPVAFHSRRLPLSVSRRTIIALPAVLAVTSLTPGVSLARNDSRTVTICLSLEPNVLDPTTAAAAAIGAVVHGNILEGLTKLAESGDVLPLLAQDWEVSPDGKRYTFRLKENVLFHDGSALDAAVIKFSMERAKAAGHKNKLQETLFNNIVGIYAQDVYTIVLDLRFPDPYTLFRLAESPAVILHPASADQTGHHPVGTGPFRFENRVAGEMITLTRWPGYRDADRVRIDTATFCFIGDPIRQTEAVLRGNVDVLFNIATQSVRAFQANNRYEVLIGGSGSKGLLALNNRRKPLNDVNVRRAIMHAIDREGFIREALDGRGRAIGSHFVPTDPGYLNLTGMYPYDPDKARALLQTAGVSDLELTLTIPPTPYAQSGGPVIVQSLANVGIRVTQNVVSWSQWLSGPFAGDFDLTIINHAEPLDYHIYTLPDYYFGYDSPAFRQLVRRHATSTNPRQQRTLFNEIQRHLANDAVNAWLFTPQISTVVRKGLKGVWMNYPIFFHDIAAMYWE